MAPFQYDTPSAPLAGSIADIMLRGGAIRAQAAQDIARTNAIATAARGNMWGNIVSSISQVPAQMQQARIADQTAQSNAAYRSMQMAQIGQQLQEHDRATKDEQLFAQSINELAPKYKSIDKDTGTPVFDFDGLTTELQKRGVNPALTEGWVARAAQLQTTISNSAKQQQAARQTVLDELGNVAQASLTPDAFAMNLRTAVQGGKVPAAQANATLQMLNEQSDNYDGFRAGVLQLAPSVGERALGQQKTQAEIDKLKAEAAKQPPRVAPEQEALDSYARAILGPTANASQLNDAQRQAYDKRKAGVASAADFDKFVREQQYKNANPPVADQNKAEQQYRTVLRGAMSNRSGGIGLEDSKVQSANHLIALLDSNYDPKTGNYNIPPTLQTELAIGLAKLMAPNGNVGIEMVHEVNQRTARGDLVGAYNFATGSTATGAPQDVLRMFKDSIERQGQVAQQNRDGEMNYLRGLAPTELEPARREALEKTGLNPLRQSRIAVGKDGQRKLFVSLDGGKTWQ